MLILLDGIDGSGKSTIIDYIKKNTLCKEYQFNDIYGKKHDLDSLKYRFDFCKDKDIIFHRFHLSEWTYDFTLRNRTFDLKKFEIETFGKYLDKIFLISVDIDAKIAWKRILERDNKMETQNLTLDREVFKFAFQKSLIKNKIMIYNNSISKTKNEIAKFLNFK